MAQEGHLGCRIKVHAFIPSPNAHLCTCDIPFRRFSEFTHRGHPGRGSSDRRCVCAAGSKRVDSEATCAQSAGNRSNLGIPRGH